MNPNRIIVLGAGFSCPAGLPLGRDLLPLVLQRARSEYGSNSVIERELREFQAYKRSCDGIDLDASEVDLEEFVGFLDVEHSLRLSGSDTLTEDGNGAQLAIRSLIGEILQARTPRDMTQVPQAYRTFASRLSPGDTILTFNYDILLERLLEDGKKPFRRFPFRYKSVYPTYCEVESNRDEVVVLKLHGSVDWFYRRDFDLCCKVLRQVGDNSDPRSTLFGKRARYSVGSLVQGPRPPDAELNRMFRVLDPDLYYRDKPAWEAPYLLAPSSAKALYATPLRELWNGLGEAGGMNFGFSVIGFSIPKHDEYLRQMIYRIARNFQHFEPDLAIGGRRKSKAVLVDCRRTPALIEDLRVRYSFLDWARTDLHVDGFDDRAVETIFGDCAGAG